MTIAASLVREKGSSFLMAEGTLLKLTLYQVILAVAALVAASFLGYTHILTSDAVASIITGVLTLVGGHVGTAMKDNTKKADE